MTNESSTVDEYTTTSPVAFFIFNRPEKTAKVFQRIAAVEPDTLLLVADGPRENYDEKELCEATRTVVTEGVDWDCDLRTNFADTNQGIKHRFVSGLEWIFSEIPEAIILEDDCVPNTDFFRFCDKMLEEYRDDKRIMDVSGSNHLGTWKANSQDYHFSMYGGIWGWATWRRAWECYDPEMNLWQSDEVRERLRDVIANRKQFEYMRDIYERTYTGDIETWDYQWGFARHINSALSIVPAKNLVSNIGFDAQATHTQEVDSDWADLRKHRLDLPVTHPEYIAVDREYDKEFHQTRPISDRLKVARVMKQFVRKLVGDFDI